MAVVSQSERDVPALRVDAPTAYLIIPIGCVVRLIAFARLTKPSSGPKLGELTKLLLSPLVLPATRDVAQDE